MLILAVGLFGTSLAFAFDGPTAAENYYKLSQECRLGETPEGQTLTKEQSDKSCTTLDAVGKELTANGYCWDTSEQEWATCK